MMNAWVKDLRFACRGLARTPGFTAIAVGTLGLAMGAAAGIFSVVDAVLLDPLPYRDTDRLVYIGGTAPGSDLPSEFNLSLEFYLHYRERSKLLDDISTFNAFTATFRTDERTERIWMSAPTASLFGTLGVDPVLGRLPTAEDESNVVVLSHALWTTWFGRDPSVLGRSYYVAGENRTVIGVMGPDFWFPNDGTLLWIPWVVRPEDIEPGRFGQALVARVAGGVTRETLVSELAVLARQLPERFGGSRNYERIIERHRPVVRSLEAELLGDVERPLWLLLGAVGIVLVIACANVANLFMARCERRQRELAVRRALGASLPQQVRSVLAEAAVIAVLAGTLALGLAHMSVPLLVQYAPGRIPRLGEAHVAAPTLAFALGLCLFSVAIFGLVPAVRASMAGLSGLRDGERGSTRRRAWGRYGSIVAQTALALVLLVGSSLLIRSFSKLRDVDPGYDTRDVFTFQIAPEGAHLVDAPSFARFHMDFMDRLRALPGVESVGVVENVPLNEGIAHTRFRTEETPDEADAGTLLGFTWAGGDYFETMEIGLVRGRAFVETDHTTSLGNVILSRSAAELLWPNEDPIGRRLRRGDMDTWETVVGVVEDVLQYSYRDEPEALVYFPLVERSAESRPIASPAYVMRTHRAEEIGPAVRALVREVAPEAPMYRVYTMEGLASRSMAQLSFVMLTLGIASGLALVIGMTGLYGALSYVVSERTREIGLRVALGAPPERVIRMVLAQGARVLALGIAIGIAVAAGTTRSLESLLFEVEAVDVATFLCVSLAMALVGLVATYLPARRASLVDPMRSLRAG